MLLFEIFLTAYSKKLAELNFVRLPSFWSPKTSHLIFANITAQLFAPYVDLIHKSLICYLHYFITNNRFLNNFFETILATDPSYQRSEYVGSNVSSVFLATQVLLIQ